jgi:hypothetical protein
MVVTFCRGVAATFNGVAAGCVFCGDGTAGFSNGEAACAIFGAGTAAFNIGLEVWRLTAFG